MNNAQKAKLRRSWLKVHAAGEKQLKAALVKFFAAQRSRIAAAAKDLKTLTVASARELLNVKDEHDWMMTAVEPILGNLLATGAARIFVMRPAKLKKTSKAFDFSASDLEDFDLPAHMITSMQSAFDNLAGQQYWKDIQDGTLLQVRDSLARGIEDGLSVPNLKKLLLAEHKGMSEVRAAAIARTETNAAMAAGAQSSYETLRADGDELQKAWISIVDADTRPDHAAADNQTVDVEEEFTLGSEKCMAPGAPSLSAKQRCNCRCGTVGVWGEE